MNIPDGLKNQDLVDLLNTAMIAINANVKEGNPVVSAWIKEDYSYSLVEMRSAQEATNAHQLDELNILGKVNLFFLIFTGN